MKVITQDMLDSLRTGSHPDSANEKLYQAASILLKENETLRKQIERPLTWDEIFSGAAPRSHKIVK